jgi:hypothetical protein
MTVFDDVSYLDGSLWAQLAKMTRGKISNEETVHKKRSTVKKRAADNL